MLLGHLCFFFGKMSIQVFCPIFKSSFVGVLILNYMNYLSILDIILSLIISLASILYFSVDCLILSMNSFAVQKLLSLSGSHLFNFVFLFLFGGIDHLIPFPSPSPGMSHFSKEVLNPFSTEWYLETKIWARCSFCPLRKLS